MNSELSELEEQAKKIAEELKAKKKELKRKSKRSIKWVTNTWNRLKRNPEFITIPIAVGIFLTISIPLRMFSERAGAFDPGYLQIPTLSSVFIFVYLSLAFLIVKLLFGTIYKYFLGEDYKKDFKNLTGWERIKISYSIYFALFFALVLLSYIRT